MKPIILLIVFGMVGCSSQEQGSGPSGPEQHASKIIATDVTGLRLGYAIPPNAIDTGRLVMASPSLILPEYEWASGDTVYTIGADRPGHIQFISTSSRTVQTKEGVRVGQTLAEVLNIQGASLGYSPGWGYVVRLPSGWKAALFLDGEFLDREPTDSDMVDMLFKR